MKTNRFIHLFTIGLGLTTFATVGCAEKAKDTGAALPSAQNVAAASPDAASSQWSDIKDLTYDTRAQFFSGLKRLEARVDGQIVELTAQRAAMTSTANTKDWDFAMKEMGNARAYLKSTGEVLSKASSETWSQEKEKVGQAWVRTQEAYAKVKSSTTT